MIPSTSIRYVLQEGPGLRPDVDMLDSMLHLGTNGNVVYDSLGAVMSEICRAARVKSIDQAEVGTECFKKTPTIEIDGSGVVATVRRVLDILPQS
eukprot:2790594-Pyramimonas_sp.AAC.1